MAFLLPLFFWGLREASPPAQYALFNAAEGGYLLSAFRKLNRHDSSETLLYIMLCAYGAVGIEECAFGTVEIYCNSPTFAFFPYFTSLYSFRAS